MFLLTSFLLGLASSFHCIGMCGPIAMALPLDRSSVGTQIGGLLSYNFGRLYVYGMLGLVFGSIGFSFHLYRIFQILSIVLGGLFILLAWRKSLVKYFEWKNSPVYSFVIKKMGYLLQRKSNSSLLLLGILNGILPCGLIFIALANSLLASNFWWSAAAMLTFGLGTVPGMFSVGFFAHRITKDYQAKAKVLYPVLMTIIGAMIILRGSNLGIPYVSPKIEMVAQNVGAGEKQVNKLVINCHKPESTEQDK